MQRDGASRLAKKIPIIKLRKCSFELFLIKNGQYSVENYCIGKKFKIVLKTTYEKVPLKYQYNARFPSLCLASEKAFLTYFYSKNGYNSAENGRIEIKFKLVLKATHKNLFLKCQDNAKFHLLCLASENAFLSYLYSKNGHNSAENDRTRKNLNLFWRLPIRSLS